jgi:hypothetical protein
VTLVKSQVALSRLIGTVRWNGSLWISRKPGRGREEGALYLPVVIAYSTDLDINTRLPGCLGGSGGGEEHRNSRQQMTASVELAACFAFRSSQRLFSSLRRAPVPAFRDQVY